MNLLTFFTDKGVPATGLTAKIDVWELDGTQVVVNQTMTEIGGGFYYYNYAGFSNDEDYGIRCDGGATLENYDRYKFASNEISQVSAEVEGLDGVTAGGIADAVWDEAISGHSTTDTFGQIVQDQLQFLVDIEGGRWKLDTTNNKMIFYKSDNSTIVAQFNLTDSQGNATTARVFERTRI